LKILIAFGASVIDTTGGHEYVVQMLAENIADKNHEVQIICPSPYKRCSKIKKNGVKYLQIPTYEIVSRARFIKPSFLRTTIQAIRGADAVHVHCPDSPFVFIIGILAKLLRKPLVVTILAYADDLKRSEPLFRLMGIVTVFQQTLTVLVADKIHVESEYDLSKLHFYDRKTKLIPPGIGNDILTGVPSSGVITWLKAKIRQADDEKIVLYLGRIHKVKGLDHAIAAVARLREKGKKVKLVVAGPDGGFLKTAEQIAQQEGINDGFQYVGRVNEDQKLALLDISDVLVIPSLNDVVEAYSIVASEAWARKKPVVAYAVGALKFRVIDGVNGYLAAPSDTDELSEKLLLALYSFEEVKASSDIVDWQTSAQEFKKIYKELTKSTSGETH